MTRTGVVRKATDLAHTAQLLVEAAEPEGYRAVAVHPLFRSAAEAGYEGPEAVLIELDAPRLNRAFLETRLEAALLLPVRANPDVHAERSDLPRSPRAPEAQRLLDWLEVTQEILFNRLS